MVRVIHRATEEKALLRGHALEVVDLKGVTIAPPIDFAALAKTCPAKVKDYKESRSVVFQS